jgi:hypothetical protein
MLSSQLRAVASEMLSVVLLYCCRALCRERNPYTHPLYRTHARAHTHMFLRVCVLVEKHIIQVLKPINA